LKSFASIRTLNCGCELNSINGNEFYVDGKGFQVWHTYITMGINTFISKLKAVEQKYH